jgi:Proliferating cell nuclear antigen, N-terminal domain
MKLADLPKFECKIRKELLQTVVKISSKCEMGENGIQVKQNGFKFRSMDNSHVAMLEWHIGILSFESYICKVEGMITIDFDDFKLAMDNFDDKEILSISCDCDNKLVITSDMVSMEYLISKNSIDSECKVPKIDLETQVLFSNKTVFVKKLLRLNKVSDYVIFVIPVSKTDLTEIKCVAKSSAPEEKKSLRKMECNNMVKKITTVDPFKVMFPIEYFIAFLKHLPTEEFILKLSKAMPLYAKSIIDVHSYAEYWLAPRVSDSKDMEI